MKAASATEAPKTGAAAEAHVKIGTKPGNTAEVNTWILVSPQHKKSTARSAVASIAKPTVANEQTSFAKACTATATVVTVAIADAAKATAIELTADAEAITADTKAILDAESPNNNNGTTER